MTQTQVVQLPVKSRDASARRIRELMDDWTNNTLDLGAELDRAADTFPINPKRPNERPGFMQWAKKETGLSESQIGCLLQVHRKFGPHRNGARLSHNVMRLLSVDSVPEDARREVIERVAKGEKIGPATAKEIADKHRLPTPRAANKQAKDEGRPVLASDGYIYLGGDPEKAKEGEDRRTMVYGVRRALETLGEIQLTPTQFLNYALPHQLWTAEEAKVIKRALRWLAALDAAWDKWEAPE